MTTVKAVDAAVMDTTMMRTIHMTNITIITKVTSIMSMRKLVVVAVAMIMTMVIIIMMQMKFLKVWVLKQRFQLRNLN